MTDDLTARIACALEGLKKRIPLDVELWNTEMIGVYLGRSVNFVRSHYICRADFPRAIRLPAGDRKKGGFPLWKASEVIAWTEKYREKRTT